MVGRVERAALMAACTSLAAPSMLRESSNCKMTLVLPCELCEVISLTPAMRPKALSSGVATVEAMVSGPAPGMVALTKTTGKSISGSGATGRSLKATAPARVRAMVSSVVATGCLIKTADTLRGRFLGPSLFFLAARQASSSLPSSSAASCKGPSLWLPEEAAVSEGAEMPESPVFFLKTLQSLSHQCASPAITLCPWKTQYCPCLPSCVKTCQTRYRQQAL